MAITDKITKEQLRDMILNGEDISKVDYSHITDMSNMFDGCSSLVSIPELDTSKVTVMSRMFDGCSSLVSIPELDASKVTHMSNMFNGCSSLVSIPELNTSSATDMRNMFNGCVSLKYFNPHNFHLYDFTKRENFQFLKEQYPELWLV